MNRLLQVVWCCTFACVAAGSALAEDVLFESGTLGTTGIPLSDLTSGAVPGTNVNEFVFIGTVFELDQSVLTSKVGGHFVSTSSGTFFGAIVSLDDANDLPDSNQLMSLDVLGVTVLTFPVSSAEVFGDLELRLHPGWYALVFGSGLLGTNGDGAAVRNGMDLGDPLYFSAQPHSGPGWVDISFSLPNHRFVLRGEIVPEMPSLIISLTAVMFASSFRSPCIRG